VIIVLSLVLLLSGAPLLLFSNQQVSSLSDILALIIFFFSLLCLHLFPVYSLLIEKYEIMGDAIVERNNVLRTFAGTDENFALDKKYYPSTVNQPDYL
jgi:hypothetical protein